MNINWAGQKAKIQHLVQATGTPIQWLQISSAGANAYKTGSETFGYGDFTQTFITGSFLGIISHVSAQDAITEIGFYAEDVERIYVDPDLDVSQWDRVRFPLSTGSTGDYDSDSDDTKEYLILPLHTHLVGGSGITVAKSMLVRLLFPLSGSTGV